MRLLLVEDDPMVGEGVLVGLRQEGFAVDWVRDGVTIALIAGLLLGIGAYREAAKNLAEDVKVLSENLKGMNTDIEQISIDLARLGVAVDRSPTMRSYLPQGDDGDAVRAKRDKFRRGREAAPEMK